MTLTGDCERFHYFSFETSFLKKPFKKLQYRFLVENTTIKRATFSYQTSLSKANAKILEWGVQNGPITKNRVLPLTTSIFSKSDLSIRTSYK